MKKGYVIAMLISALVAGNALAQANKCTIDPTAGSAVQEGNHSVVYLRAPGSKGAIGAVRFVSKVFVNGKESNSSKIAAAKELNDGRKVYWLDTFSGDNKVGIIKLTLQGGTSAGALNEACTIDNKRANLVKEGKEAVLYLLSPNSGDAIGAIRIDAAVLDESGKTISDSIKITDIKYTKGNKFFWLDIYSGKNKVGIVKIIVQPK